MTCYCSLSGAEPDIFIWGATGGASFATRGAVNGLCRTFRKRPEKFWGGQAKFWGAMPPRHPLSSAPALCPSTDRHERHCSKLQNTGLLFYFYFLIRTTILFLNMGVGRICSGGPLRDFSKIFPRGAKVVKFVFSHSKLRKKSFLLKFSKSRGAQGPLALPSDAHVSEPSVVTCGLKQSAKSLSRLLDVSWGSQARACKLAARTSRRELPAVCYVVNILGVRVLNRQLCNL